MKIIHLKNTHLKYGILVLAALFALAPLFTGIQPVKASDPAYNSFVEYPSNPVFDPAERAYYPCVIFNGTGYQLWYDDGTGTRYTTSADGLTWAAGTPVNGLTNGRHAVVVNTGSKYIIWYEDSSQLYSINDIRTAESVDGINWTLDAPITQVGSTVITGIWPDWNRGSYGPCQVFYDAGGSSTIVVPADAASVWQNKFVMYYDGTDGGLEDIGVAVSADGKLWQGYNGGVAPVLAHAGGTAWDSNYTTFCSVQKIGSLYHMWYSGGQAASNEGIGYAQSSDGVNWTRDTANPMMHFSDGISWRSVRTYTPRVLYDAASFSGAGESVQLKMWYNGTTGGNYALGYASLVIPAPTPTPTPGPTVGGRVNQVDKMEVLMPYIIAGLAGLAAVLIGRKLVKKHIPVKVKVRK